MCEEIGEQTASFPEPRGPRRRIELLQASATELEIMNFSLLKIIDY
jgi:hypothetical protein